MTSAEEAIAAGKIIVLIAAGFVAGFSAVFAFNHIPTKWLCDYECEPTEEMWGKRIEERPWSLVFSFFFIGAGLIMREEGVLYLIPAIPALWLLLIVAIADCKFMIIPDQLVIGLAILSIGFIPCQNGLLSPLFGALSGGGSLLAIGLIARFILKREAMGFGDVKLMGALGLIAGLKGTLIILMLTIFSSGVVMGTMCLSGRVKKDDQLPLGPFIAASAGCYIIFRPLLLTAADWYIGLY